MQHADRVGSSIVLANDPDAGAPLLAMLDGCC